MSFRKYMTLDRLLGLPRERGGSAGPNSRTSLAARCTSCAVINPSGSDGVTSANSTPGRWAGQVKTCYATRDHASCR